MTDPARATLREASEPSRLSRESIIEAGMRIAARPGTASVTVRDLGKQLGVDPTAIYRHFRNKEELMAALLERLISIASARATVDPLHWKSALTELADNLLATYLEYPAVAAEAAILSTGGSAELDGIEFILSCLGRAGLEGEELIEYYQLFSSHLLALGSIIAQTQIAQSQSGRGEVERAYVPETVGATHSGHPATAAHREALLALDDFSVYRTGIRMILDSAAAAGAASAQGER
ncbi:MAG TPA: helix-turn-helix domain-containing protein [Terrimesophilobacter sp.]|nr:helix-turn-helix domain-containing protein [Terrimesophilobacter sp.]